MAHAGAAAATAAVLAALLISAAAPPPAHAAHFGEDPPEGWHGRLPPALLVSDGSPAPASPDAEYFDAVDDFPDGAAPSPPSSSPSGFALVTGARRAGPAILP
ncbi:hypothetical protein U9M48_026608 [Paspalum notatum var. saurae]|uniref:Uncharacterized protein n=1 Tax=Paspalum notatum var. saurae TaxID=547442 RepID=A0AAQ3WYH4_PASNO